MSDYVLYITAEANKRITWKGSEIMTVEQTGSIDGLKFTAPIAILGADEYEDLKRRAAINGDTPR